MEPTILTYRRCTESIVPKKNASWQSLASHSKRHDCKDTSIRQFCKKCSNNPSTCTKVTAPPNTKSESGVSVTHQVVPSSVKTDLEPQDFSRTNCLACTHPPLFFRCTRTTKVSSLFIFTSLTKSLLQYKTLSPKQIIVNNKFDLLLVFSAFVLYNNRTKRLLVSKKRILWTKKP